MNQYAKRLVNSGSAPDSFMTRVLTSSDESGASETEAAYVALKLIAAASDTVSVIANDSLSRITIIVSRAA